MLDAVAHMTTFVRNYWILLAIIVIATFLRLFSLSQYPVGIYGDEASIGYNSYSLLKTAHDQDGHFMPLSFDQFGNFRAAGYHYFDIPFVAIFGLNALAVRLPAAIFGILTIPVLFLLINELFENKTISYLGAFLLAIMPWHINISRASSESIIALFFIVLSIYLLLIGFKKKTFYILPIFLSFLSLLLSIFTYHSPTVFLPLFLPFFFILLFLQYKPTKAKVIAAVMFYAAILIAIMLFLTLGKGIGRADQVSLLSLPGAKEHLRSAMGEEGNINPLITRFYDNKIFFYGRYFLTFYSQHLTLDFLFINTGSPIRYLIPFTGNLYIIEAPFLLIGFVVLLYEGIKKKKWLYWIPLAWLLIGPIPAAATWEDLPNVVRSSLMIPSLMIITAFGFYTTTMLLKKNLRILFIIICSLILLQNFLYFYHNYFWRLKIQEPWYRSASESDLIYTVDRLAPQFSDVYMTTEHNNNFIFYLFYNAFDPKKFQAMGSPREYNTLHFEKITYLYDGCPLKGDPLKITEPKTPTTKILYVDKENCELPKNAEILQIIRTPDGAPSFIIATLKYVDPVNELNE